MIPKQISIGPLTVHLYGLIIALSIFLGWFLAKRRAHLYKIPRTIFDDPILLIPLVLAIIGARIYHVLDFWDYYSNNLNQILAITNGGLGIWGALIGVFLGFYLVAKVKKLDFLKILDLAAPSLLVGQALGRIGNFINQEGFGPPTEKPWGVFIEVDRRPPQYLTETYFHPTFFYEAALDAIFLIILLYFAKRLKFKGQVFALYLMFYSSARFIAEFWRIDTWIIGSIKAAYMLSAIAFLIGIWIFFKSTKINQSRP